MKKKMVLFFLLAMLAVSMLVGCGTGKNKTEKTEDNWVGLETDTEAGTQEIVYDKTNESIPVKNVDEFKVWAKELIDLDKYDDPYEFGGLFSYHLKTENMKIDAKEDSDILFSDGSEITLPIAKDEVEKKGWKLCGENLKGVVTYYEYQNEKGQSIFLAESTIKEEPGVYSSLMIVREFGDKTVTPAEFCVRNNVTNGSSVQEVVKSFGEPYSLSYYEEVADKNKTNISLSYMGRMNSDFTFSIKENKIMELSINVF